MQIAVDNAPRQGDMTRHTEALRVAAIALRIGVAHDQEMHVGTLRRKQPRRLDQQVGALVGCQQPNIDHNAPVGGDTQLST